MFTWPPDRLDVDKSCSSTSTPASPSNLRTLQHLLGALSFEHFSSSLHKKRHAISYRSIEPVLPPTTPLVMPKAVARRSTIRRSSLPLVVHSNRILFVTLDPDGHVEDIFYDAQEFGDGVDDDEFAPSFRRESVLLSSVFVASHLGSGSASDDGVLDGPSLLLTSESEASSDLSCFLGPPSPPEQLPLRFLRAGKGDVAEGTRRYQATLAWRKEHQIDTILSSPSLNYQLIKRNFKSFCHLRGRNNEPCYYEQPPKTNLKALQAGGVTVPMLLRHYTMVTEYLWQYIERDDLARSITIIDLDGIRFGDFVGDVIDFVKKASQFCGQHYPERAGCVYVINVPGWFKLIWNVIKPWIDEVTLEKIKILRGKEEIRNAMQERIPLENIPPEYGGLSMPLGQSPEEVQFAELVEHHNAIGRGETPCAGVMGACPFCSWVPARCY
jgi:hypothetical protein